MPIRRLPNSSERTRCSFYESFNGSLYDNRFWAVTGSGSLTLLAAGTNGVAQLRANASSNYSLAQGGLCAFSVAKSALFWSRFKLPSAASVYVEIGLLSSSQYAVIRSNVTWRSYTSDAGGSTTYDSGVALDTEWHEVEIRTRSGNIDFLFDGVLWTPHTTNLPTEDLQPFFYVGSSIAATKDLYIDTVLVEGDRA